MELLGHQYIQKTREYLDYLEEHLNNVQRAYKEVCEACFDSLSISNDAEFRTELERQISEHDLSKFSAEEFVQYRKSFFPIEPKEKLNCGMSTAWENHKKYNSHHHESVKTAVDIAHMVIDWTAMGYKFGDTAQQYYEANRDKIKLKDKQLEFMYEIFHCLRQFREFAGEEDEE